MKMYIKIIIFLLAILTQISYADEIQPLPMGIKLDYTDPVKNTEPWFRAARFGLFIDWSPRVEWPQKIKCPYGWEDVKTSQKGSLYSPIRDENGNLTGYRYWENFNPQHFDAKKWMDLFIESGAQFYMLDLIGRLGWSNFNTPAGTFDCAATDWNKDLCEELAKASHGRLPVLYLQNQAGGIDFILGGWTAFMSRWAAGVTSYPQFRQISLYWIVSHPEKYGKIAGLGFAGPYGGDGEHPSREGEYKDQFNQKNTDYITNLQKMQPWMIFGTGFGMKDAKGYTPMFDLKGTTLATYRTDLNSLIKVYQFSMESDFFPNWAFGYEENGRTAREFIKLISMMASRDANFMMRVTPGPDGTIEPWHVKILKTIGGWMKRYGQTIYGTRNGPYEPGVWGGSVRKNNKIDLHIVAISEDGKFTFPQLPDGDKIKSVKLLNTGKDIPFKNEEGVFSIQLPPSTAYDINIPDKIVEITYADGYDTLAIGYNDVDNAHFKYQESFCCESVDKKVKITPWHDKSPKYPLTSKEKGTGKNIEILLRPSTDEKKKDGERYSMRIKGAPFWTPPDWFEFPNKSCEYTKVKVTVEMSAPHLVNVFSIAEKGERIKNWELRAFNETTKQWQTLYKGENSQMGLFDLYLKAPIKVKKFEIIAAPSKFRGIVKAPHFRWIRCYYDHYTPGQADASSSGGGKGKKSKSKKKGGKGKKKKK